MFPKAHLFQALVPEFTCKSFQLWLQQEFIRFQNRLVLYQPSLAGGFSQNPVFPAHLVLGRGGLAPWLPDSQLWGAGIALPGKALETLGCGVLWRTLWLPPIPLGISGCGDTLWPDSELHLVSGRHPPHPHPHLCGCWPFCLLLFVAVSLLFCFFSFFPL